MKKNILPIITGLLIAFSVNGQSIVRAAISTGGNTISNATVTLNHTVGQPIGNTISNNGIILTQGFQQGRLLTVPTIELEASSGGITVTTTIGYRNGATLGLDPGFDVGNFGGASFDLFTHLVDGSSTQDFTYQSLPDSNYETMIVPVGLKASAGNDVVFNANNSNLPSGLQVLLEDRTTGNYTILDGTTTYAVTLASNEDGIGRFYIHTKFNQSVWDGDTNTTWNLATNWSGDVNPLTTNNVLITNSANTPNITSGLVAEMHDITVATNGSFQVSEDGAAIVAGNFDNSGTVTITSAANESGAFLVKGTANGTIIYERGGLLANKWSIVTAPVEGQSIKDFVENPMNNIRINTTVTPNRYAVGYYDDSNLAGSKWVYYTTTDLASNILTFEKGRSYIISRATDGVVTFTGTIATIDVNKNVVPSQWNAVGNPYTAYVPVNDNGGVNFIQDNLASFDPTYVGVYIWDNAQNKYVANSLVSAAKSLAPGQGFFIRTTTGVNSVVFKESLRTVQKNGGVFNRDIDETSKIELYVSAEAIKVNTTIAYMNNATLGLDPAYDLGNFEGTKIDVFTHLVENNKNENFTYQSLPKKALGTKVIPIGVKAVANTELEFSAKKINLPEGVEILLEDRKLNKFTEINTTDNYRVKLSETINGVGRFYIHTSANTLNTPSFSLSDIKIYNTDASLVVEGIQNEDFKMSLYTTLGAEIFTKNYKGIGKNSIELPDTIATGVFIVRIATTNGMKDKKIIIK
ncbi:T9SS type A sorting domain-containing protein [Tenacibaculum amylolyticum]|uniref:T9SS type A sorting domain-containing protein n=1 Tax=Tenacibaculum amylolyticum TaxID=104269 RepID=UPI003893BFFE